MRSFRVLSLTLGILNTPLLATFASADWPLDGSPVCTAPMNQTNPQIVPDGSGGVYVTWEDLRSGMSGEIFLQRLDGTGTPLWMANGVSLVHILTRGGFGPQIVSDGAGGCIATWWDNRNDEGDIYAQRVDGAGAPQWIAGGVALSTAEGQQYNPEIVSDGVGGAIVTWEGTDGISAQRVNASGAPQWISNGVVLCTVDGNPAFHQVVSDGGGGAIVTWDDERSSGLPEIRDIYAQRVDAAGVPLWTANGVGVCTNPFNQAYPTLASDGGSGAIVAWKDGRVAAGIYAQRLNGAGAPQWTANGMALCIPAAAISVPHIGPDGGGGAIVAWSDHRDPATDLNIYAQRINGAGLVQWTANGVALCTAEGTQWIPQIISDGSDGAIMTWEDERSGNRDIYAQRVDGAGAPQWTPNGMVVCASGESRSQQIASHGLGGAIVTWADGRNDSTLLDIYAQRIPTDVTAVVEAGGPVAEFVGPFPNPASEVIGFEVATARAGMLRVKVMDVAGRLVRCIHDGPVGVGRQSFEWDLRREGGARVAKGVYLITVDGAVHVPGRKVVLR